MSKAKYLIINPITNPIEWDMAKLISDRQNKASETDTSKVDWEMLEVRLLGYLEETLTNINDKKS